MAYAALEPLRGSDLIDVVQRRRSQVEARRRARVRATAAEFRLGGVDVGAIAFRVHERICRDRVRPDWFEEMKRSRADEVT